MDLYRKFRAAHQGLAVRCSRAPRNGVVTQMPQWGLTLTGVRTLSATPPWPRWTIPPALGSAARSPSGCLLSLYWGSRCRLGDAEISVDLDTLTGRAGFGELESWPASAAPGARGSGRQWLDGDLAYTIAVRGNGFIQTGGDAGRLTGAFVGPSHETATSTLERTDLTAAFGASR